MVSVLESNNDVEVQMLKLFFLTTEMWRKCKNCCYLHGFELKSISFPIRGAWDCDDIGLAIVMKRVLKYAKRTVYGVSTHSTLKQGWHKHVVSTGMALLCLIHECCVC